MAGFVTFIFDDDNWSHYNIMFPEFNTRGKVGCKSLPSDSMLADPTGVTQCLEMQTAGWEILSHSKTHVDLTTLSEAEIIVELSQSKIDLEGLGFVINNFVYPYNRYNDFILATIPSYYNGARAGASGISGDYYNPRFSYLGNLYIITGIDVSDETKTETFKTYIKEAELTNKWIVFINHACTEADAVNFRILSDYCDVRGVPIGTFQQGLNFIQANYPSTTPSVWNDYRQPNPKITRHIDSAIIRKDKDLLTIPKLVKDYKLIPKPKTKSDWQP